MLCFPAQSRVNQPCHRQRAESLLTASWRRKGNTACELIRPPPNEKGLTLVPCVLAHWFSTAPRWLQVRGRPGHRGLDWAGAQPRLHG